MTCWRTRLQVGAQLDQHLGGHALALADEAEEDVLGADVVVAELQRLAQRQLEDLLGAGRERDVPAGRRAALADDLLDLVADGLERDAERLERLGRDALALVDEAEQDVLGADVVVVEEPRLFLGQDDDPSGSVGEAFEQVDPPPRTVGSVDAQSTGALLGRRTAPHGSVRFRCLRAVLIRIAVDVSSWSVAASPGARCCPPRPGGSDLARVEDALREAGRSPATPSSPRWPAT